MKRGLVLALLIIFSALPLFAEETDALIKETYKLQGQIEYDDNPVEVIYLDENIEKPQVNIPKRSLTLPVGVLNITSNTNSQRSALARSSVNSSNSEFFLNIYSNSFSKSLNSKFFLRNMFHVKHYFNPRYISNTEISAGLTPLIRDACPIVKGRNLSSF